MTRPVLRVCIVNFRTPDLTRDCVASLHRHPPRLARLEVVVVDNGSGDDSLARIAASCPTAQLIDAGANLGFAAGNNLALRGLPSGFALLINSDCEVEEGTLDAMLGALQRRPELGAVGARIVNPHDGADQDYPVRFPSIPEMVRRALGGPQFPLRGRAAPLEMERLHGAALMTRADVLHGVGLLDEGFFIYDEDVDWCLRARAAGWRLCLLPDARVRHLGGASSGRAPSGQRQARAPSESSLRMRFELRRSRYRLYRKWRGMPALAALKLITDAMLLADSAAWALRALRDRDARDGLRAVLRWNLRIVRFNPFRMEGPAR